MKYLIFFLLIFGWLNSFGQKKDTIVYNYIYRDTIIYTVIRQDTTKKGGIDLSNWGIGPYAGFDYTISKPYGSGFSASFGFGISYYIWRLPSLKRKKHIAD